MNSIETRDHLTNIRVVSLFDLEISLLSLETQAYLTELKTTLDPNQPYVVVYPEGHQYGHSGLTPDFPALSLDGAILVLAWIFEAANITEGEACRKYHLQVIGDKFGLITERYVVGPDARIQKIELSRTSTPSAINSLS